MQKRRIFIVSIFAIVCFFAHGISQTSVTGNITGTTTWTKAASPYILTTDITVNKGVTLTVEADVVIKPKPGYSMIVQGMLEIQGAPFHPVVFTSFKDDSYGGDANGDAAATIPKAGDWNYLRIDNSANELKNCLVRYSANGIFAYLSSPNIRNCTIERCSGTGILSENSDSVKIRNNSIDSCAVGISCGGKGLNSYPVVSGNQVTRTWQTGIGLKNCEPTVRDNQLLNNTAYPIALNGYAKPTYIGNVFSGNKYRAFALSGTTLPTGAGAYRLFNAQNLGWPYVVASNYIIGPPMTLAIDSGVVVKFDDCHMIVQGILDIQSTPAHPMVFTSFKDDTYGGDANGDAAATIPKAGDWDYLRIDNSANELKNCLVRYSGNGIYAYASSPNIHNCTIERCSGTGILSENSDSVKIRDNSIDSCAIGISCGGNGLNSYPVVNGNQVTRTWQTGIGLKNCEPTVRDNQLLNNTAYPIALDGYAKPTYTDNVFIGNKYRAFALSGTASSSSGAGASRLFNAQNLGWPYVVASNYLIGSTMTLVIDSGIVVKFEDYHMIVQGMLDIKGTPAHPVVFTSFKDDSYGGDANGDAAATIPKAGDWDYLRIDNSANVVKNCIVRYAINGIYAYNSSPSIHDCTIENPGTYGINLHASFATVNRLVFLNCPTAVYANLGNPVITNSLFSTCYNGVIVNNQDSIGILASINNCNFSGINNYYINTTNSKSDRRVNATNNWFGTNDSIAIAAKMSENLALIEYVPFASKPASPTWLRGDFNFSSSVDGVDLNFLAAAFGAAPGDANYNPLCDLRAGTPDRIDGFDLAEFSFNFGKSGIPIPKRTTAENARIDLQLLPPLQVDSSYFFEIPIKFVGKKNLQSIAFDIVLPEGFTMRDVSRSEKQPSLSSDAVALSANKNDRSIVGITTLGGKVISKGDTIGVLRFRANEGNIYGRSITLENCAYFYTTGEIISISSAHLPIVKPALPIAFDMPKPGIAASSGKIRIRYQLPRSQRIKLELFSMQGKRMAQLINEVCNPGYYSLAWSSKNEEGGPLPSGYYILAFTSKEYRRSFGLHLIR
jgi:hypothetical protein